MNFGKEEDLLGGVKSWLEVLQIDLTDDSVRSYAKTPVR